MREDSKLQNASFKSCNLKLSRLEVLTFFELLANKCWRGQYSGHISASVAYAENFHGGGSFSSIWWSFVFGVCCLWRHNLMSYSCFQTNVLAKFA